MNAFKGGHEVLLVGYEDDPREKGGGRFIVRNSWGAEWGDGGYGAVSYAYVECFCNEAGTILQDVVDYVGDGYNGLNTIPELDVQGVPVKGKGRQRNKDRGGGSARTAAIAAAAAAIAATLTWIAAKFF